MKKILLISANSELIDTLGKALPYNFVSATAFEHPEELFEQLNRQEPGLVIIDFLLDDLNGSGTTHQIKSDPKWNNLPVIILSEFTDEQMPNKFGSDGFLKKPFVMEELDKMIRELSKI